MKASLTFYQLQKLVYATSFLLDDTFTKTAYAHKDLSKCIESASQKTNGVIGFNFPREIYSRLLMPGITQKLGKVNTEFASVEALHEVLSNNAEFQDLETRCNGAGFIALHATIDFVRELLSSLPNQSQDKQDEQQEKLNRITELRNKLAKINKEEQDAQENGESLSDEKRQQRKDIIKEGKGLAQDVAQSIKEAMDQMADAVGKAASKASEKAKDAEDLMNAAGWDEDPQAFQRATNLEDKLEALAKVSQNKTLKKIILEAGNQRQLMKAVKQKKIRTGEIIRKGQKTGNDLRQVMLQELMLLGTPATRQIFNEKLMKQSLLIHKTQERKKSVAGKVVIFRDLSSSMDGTHKNIFAGAMTWVVAQEMVMQNREVKIVNFNSKPINEFTFNQRNYSEMALLEAVDVNPDGSTGWSNALDVGVEFIKGSQTTLGNEYDFMLITDGDPNGDDGTRNEQWMEKFLAFKKEYGVTLYGVMVDYKNPTKELTSISDQLIAVNEFSDSEAEDIFGLLV